VKILILLSFQKKSEEIRTKVVYKTGNFTEATSIEFYSSCSSVYYLLSGKSAF